MNKKLGWNKTGWEKAAAVTAALLVWQFAAIAFHQKLLLASPIEVVGVLLQLLQKPEFYHTLLFSLGRIMTGFSLAFVIGTTLAVLAARFSLIELLLWPYMAAVKATPVASIVILCLVWLSPKNLSIFICFLVLTPIFYANIGNGIRHLDDKLEEMASSFRLSLTQRLFAIYLPQLRPYLQASLELTIGISWKSAVAAEVIGVPAGSVGKAIYNAKIYLDTPELFAWTFTVVACSLFIERVVMFLFGKGYEHLEKLF